MSNTIRRSVAAPFRYLVRKARSVAHSFDPVRKNFVSLQPVGTVRGRVLIAHLVEGLLLAPDDPLIRTHNHFVEARLMAEAFLEQGYAVDFIDYRNRWFVPRKRYDIFVCPRNNFESLAEKMPPDCIKIVHLDTAHWLYNNAAALRRLQDVRNQRGVALASYTEIKANRAIESADYATMLGNDFDYETYAFAGKQIFQVPNPGTTLYPWLEDKDFAACRNRFLWLGSRGFVHKGLDLVLEAFARMPDLHLTVCGPLERDPHFVEAFRKELYETPNIHTHGWIDITGPDFADLAKRTIAHVYPTCADACCGSVVNCMHAGLIPLATREAGVDIDPSFGLRLSAPSVEAVEVAARRIAALPTDRLAAMARASWEEARRIYGPEYYKQIFGAVIDRIVNGHPDAITPDFVPMEAVRCAPDRHESVLASRPAEGGAAPHVPA